MLESAIPHGYNVYTPFGLNPWQGYKWRAQNADKPWSCQVQGQRYARFEVRDGDVISFDQGVELKNRSEMYLPASTELTQFPYGVPVWISFAMRIPSITELVPIDPMPAGQAPGMGCAQMHGPGASNPPWSLVMQTNGDLYVATAGNWAGGTTGGNVTRATIPAPARDVWHQFVFSLTFNATANGAMTAWFNGQQIFTGPVQMGFSALPELYLKFGTYRHNMRGVSVLEFANLEAGTDSLAARVATPLPLP